MLTNEDLLKSAKSVGRTLSFKKASESRAKWLIEQLADRLQSLDNQDQNAERIKSEKFNTECTVKITDAKMHLGWLLQEGQLAAQQKESINKVIEVLDELSDLFN